MSVRFSYRTQDDAQRASGAPLLSYDLAQITITHVDKERGSMALATDWRYANGLLIVHDGSHIEAEQGGCFDNGIHLVHLGVGLSRGQVRCKGIVPPSVVEKRVVHSATKVIDIADCAPKKPQQIDLL